MPQNRNKNTKQNVRLMPIPGTTKMRCMRETLDTATATETSMSVPRETSSDSPYQEGTWLNSHMEITTDLNCCDWIVLSHDQTLYHRPSGTVLPMKTAIEYTFVSQAQNTMTPPP